jgi:hypothetical protein
MASLRETKVRGESITKSKQLIEIKNGFACYSDGTKVKVCKKGQLGKLEK